MSLTSFRLQDVSFGYQKGERVLDGIDLELGSGLVLLLGPNGCGKSTLMKLLAGVEKPDSGCIEVGGLDLWKEEAEARRLLAYVPELPDVTPYAAVTEVLELVARLRGEGPGQAAAALAELDLSGLGGRSIRELSKGQRRRVLLAAARIGAPPIWLLDEPFDALDRQLRDVLHGWLVEHVTGGGLVVAVTHEIEMLASLATAAVAMSGGRPLLVPALPETEVERSALLERLARGQGLARESR